MLMMGLKANRYAAGVRGWTAAGLAGLFVLLSGCGGMMLSIANVNTQDDTIKKTHSDRMTSNPLSCDSEDHMSYVPDVHLLIERYWGPDYRVKYRLIALVRGGGFIGIEEGEALVIMADGRRIGFSGPGGSAHMTSSGSTMIEEAWYDTAFDQLSALVEAKEIKLKITGKDYSVNRCFSLTNIDNFKVYLKYFPPYAAVEGR